MSLQKLMLLPLGIFDHCKILPNDLIFSEGKIESRNSHFKIECVKFSSFTASSELDHAALAHFPFSTTATGNNIAT